MRTLLATCLLVLLFAGCRNPGLITGRDKDTSAAVGRYLVEYEHANWAWGYTHFGLVVDDAGGVYLWRFERTDQPWQPNDQERYTYEQLKAKYAHDPVFKGTVGADTLNEIRSLLPWADELPLGDRAMRGADMGQTNSVAWKYDRSTRLYYRVLLKTTGDWDQERPGTRARRLVAIIEALAARFQ